MSNAKILKETENKLFIIIEYVLNIRDDYYFMDDYEGSENKIVEMVKSTLKECGEQPLTGKTYLKMYLKNEIDYHPDIDYGFDIIDNDKVVATVYIQNLDRVKNEIYYYTNDQLLSGDGPGVLTSTSKLIEVLKHQSSNPDAEIHTMTDKAIIERWFADYELNEVKRKC